MILLYMHIPWVAAVISQRVFPLRSNLRDFLVVEQTRRRQNSLTLDRSDAVAPLLSDFLFSSSFEIMGRTCCSRSGSQAVYTRCASCSVLPEIATSFFSLRSWRQRGSSLPSVHQRNPNRAQRQSRVQTAHLKSPLVLGSRLGQRYDPSRRSSCIVRSASA